MPLFVISTYGAVILEKYGEKFPKVSRLIMVDIGLN